MVVWMDYKRVIVTRKRLRSNKKVKTLNMFLPQNVDQPINSDSVEISGGFNGKKVLKKLNKSLNY